MPVLIYKCPNCDGDVRFDPESQGFKCEYCESVFSQEAGLKDGSNAAVRSQPVQGSGVFMQS